MKLLLYILIGVAILGAGWYFFGSKNMSSDTSQQPPTADEAYAMIPKPGTYATMMASASSPGRTISLVLNPDSTVTFTQDYQNANPPIVQTGKASVTSGNLLVVLDAQAGEQLATPETMNFTYDSMNAGVLTLVDYDMSVWGEAGLVMQNAAPFLNTTWIWESTLMSDGAQTMTNAEKSFGLVFSDLGAVSVRTDCNGAAGNYKLMELNGIAIGPLAQTLMACENSQELPFLTQLQSVNSYVLIDGNLHLLLPYDSGTMTFTPGV